MRTSIDKIYAMLSWKNDISVQYHGIKKAKKIKNLWVFIMPILPEDSKSVWENCSKILADKSDSELKPYLNHLFEWLQDMNWPGALTIYDRLLKIPFLELESSFNMSFSLSQDRNDKPWENELKAFKQEAIKRQSGNTGYG